ncbi:DNA-binding protein [Rhizobium sp. R72]|uniref:helix-turn-helix transcriptional regulator n=1 Tax=unclassified Rhizobium TaxID=2613769 RepID=UPI000B52E0A6|nr:MULTISPECIES: LuxR C-terminal-related transcriptional regulator [unclassified Rhizobium]OWV82836.1 DNA-binding protein [Rhizobium sp. R693]OWV93726.1 DNA-binding protein [Rhizobium sp. R72]OWV93964.1 DNA-binding protein [Rhizobium sp. R711]
MKRQERAVRGGAGDTVFSRIASGQKMSMERFSDYVAEIATEAGFNHYLLAEFPRGDRSGFVSNYLVGNWPQELVNFYEEADLFYCCKLIAALKRTAMPVFCDNPPFESAAANQENQQLTTLFRVHGLKSTFAFALHDMHLRQYVFVFSGDRVRLTRAEAMEHVFRAMEFLELYGQQNPPEQPTESLSNREVECLRWSAAGKSSEEIAIILDLSAHTVVGYLKSAMRKLDSVNRMQAIARAFRYRLL